MWTIPFELILDSRTPFRVAAYPPGATFGPRPLRNWEFVWMLEGDAAYTRGTATVAAPEGAIVLCRPGAVDAFRWDPRRRTRHAYFHFELQGDLPADWPEQGAWPLVRDPRPEADLLRPLFRHLLAWGNHGDALQTRLTAAALLAAYVTGEVESDEVRGRPALPDPVQRAWDHIRRRLDDAPAERIALSEIADAACVSPEHLCRLFRSATGHSPVETVRLARLDRAASLLVRSNYSIAEIATLCGFESPFHFSRRFKAAFGRSPRAVRQSVAAGEPAPTSRLVSDG
jgi:AraC-like DNA-binding protein